MVNNTIKIGLMLLVIFTACQKRNLKHAEKSLEGSWAVQSIYSAYGQNTNLGIQTNEEFNEDGPLGQFNFDKEMVTYRFTRLDTLYESNSAWNLVREKINAGFTKAEQYTLEMDKFEFICAFGDQTSDAEKQATEVKLMFETKTIGSYYTFELDLRKKE